MTDQVTNVPAPDSFSPKLSSYIGMLLLARKRTLELVNGISQEVLDFTVHERKIETIGTLLYHIAAAEFSWFMEDIGKQEMPMEDWKYAFPLRSYVNVEQLKGKSVQFYLDILADVRKQSLELLPTLNDSDLDRVLFIDDRNWTIEWILWHVHEHEIYHAGQINFLKRIQKIS